jgi:hypothetical protein
MKNEIQKPIMNKTICVAAGLLALMLMPVFGQPSRGLTKFNLDFPGGTPKELVAAIEKATSKPLNAIIPDEAAGTKLPPLKMDNVDTVQLFAALGAASVKQEYRVTSTAFGFGPYGGGSYSSVNTGFGFKTDGDASDNSIWYFYVLDPPQPPDFSRPPPAKTCHFYQLQPFLNKGLTVDDITTAIQTGWKMEGADPAPQLNYHKETKLLIAYGDPDKLKVIDDVLAALQSPTPTPQNPGLFQQRLQSLINTTAPSPGIPRPFGSGPGGSSQVGGGALSPEAQALLIERTRTGASASTNPTAAVPVPPESPNPPDGNSTQ